MIVRITRAQVLFAATALSCLLVVSLAVAGAAGRSDDRQATASASVKKKIKKLKKQVKAHEQRLAELEGEQGGSRPPSGSAGGDLTGSYPNPLIAGNAVGTSEVANGTIGSADIGANAVGTSEVADGSIGSADLAPAARGARAYGRIAANGVLSLSRIKNVASVTHPTTGVYCIALAESINPDSAVLVVGPDFTGSSTNTTLEDFPVIQWRSSNSAFCPDGRLEVFTFTYHGDPTDDDDGGGNTTGDDLDVDNEPFTFVVP